MEKAYCYKHNPIVKNIFLTMLIPTIFMNLTTSIASMADTMIIGQYLDDAALSVVTFAMPIFMIINMFSALFAVGGCIAMSIDAGKGDREGASKAFSTAIELLLSVSLVLVLAAIFLSWQITGWLGASEDVFEMVQLYVKIIMSGGPVFVLNTGLAFFVRNDGRPKLSMVGMFSSIIVDIALNFIFVAHMNMGVAGAAYSTVAGSVVGVLVLGTHFFSAKNTLRFRFVLDSMVVRVVKNGISAALHFVYQFICILVINHLLAKLAGTDGVVVYTVVFNLATVALSVFEGISQTIQPMVSNYFGEKSYKNIKETLRLSFITIVVICGSVTVLLEIAPQVVPVIFGIEDINLLGTAATAVRIYAVSMMLTTANVVIGYYLQSTERNSMAAVLVSLRNLVIFLGATLVLGKLFGLNGIWAAYTVAEILSFLVLVCMVRAKQKGNLNFLLLEKVVEEKIVCCTYSCEQETIEDYRNKIAVPEELAADTEEYLLQLEKCITDTKGKYIEVEYNGSTNKVIIRDNLEHSKIPEGIWQCIQNGSKAEYGPVLGWNRICLEREAVCVNE